MDNQLQCKDLRTRTKNSLGVVESKFKFNRTDGLPTCLFLSSVEDFLSTLILRNSRKRRKPPGLPWYICCSMKSRFKITKESLLDSNAITP
jgi:hypothetical protein